MKTKFLKLLLLTIAFSFYQNVSAQSFSGQKYPELCSVLSRTLQQGDTGDDVRRLQVALGQEGIAYIGSTGYYGPVTARAVRTFQTRSGIYPAGKVGPQTLSYIRRLWCGGSNVTPTPNPWPIPSGVQEVSISPVSSSGNNITMGWNTRNSQRCTLNNESIPVNGTKVFSVFSEMNFLITCFDQNNYSVSKTIVIKPNQSVSNLPNVSVYINPTSVLNGQTATIFWNSTNTNYCSLTGSTGGLGGATQSTSGSYQFTATGQTQSFTVTCYNSSGQSVAQTVYSQGSSTPTGNEITLGTQSSGNQNITVSKCAVPGGSIDWGDGTARTYINTTDTSCIFTTNHAYLNNGTFIIRLYDANGSLRSSQTVTINTVGGVSTNNVGLTLTADKTNVSAGQSITFTATVRNNGNADVRFANNFGFCVSNQDVTFTTNVPSSMWAPESQPMCLSNTGDSYVTLVPGQTYTRVFTKTVLGTLNTGGTYTANAVLTLRNENGVFGTVNSNQVQFTIGSGISSGGHTVTVNSNNVTTGQSVNFSWNYNALYSCLALGCSQPENPNGVIFDLINANTNQIVGTIKRLPTYNVNDFSFSGSQNWVVTKSLQDIRNDAIVCTTINGENICGTPIYSGNYKIRATFFNPANACFGFCPQVPGQKIITTIDSSEFYINSTLSTIGGTAGNLTLVSRVNGYVVVNLPGCTAGKINWGDGIVTNFMNENTGCNFGHQYPSGNIGQSYTVSYIDMNNVLRSSIQVLPYPFI